jgi:hypothetical protein
MFLAAQSISGDLSRIQSCIDFFGASIVIYHNDGNLSSQSSKVTSGVLFDLQQYAAYTGKSLEFFLDQHLSSGELLKWPTQTSEKIKSLDIKRFERRVVLESPADLPFQFKTMLREMQSIINDTYEIQTQLQLGLVQVTRLKTLLQTIAKFISQMSVHLFPDPQQSLNRVIYPADANIPKEVVDAMVETETKIKRDELKTMIDDIQMRVKEVDRSIFTSSSSSTENSPSTSTIKKKARITGAKDSYSSCFTENPPSSDQKREKLKPKLPTGSFTAFSTHNP